MRILRSRALLVAGLMVVTSALATFARPTEHLTDKVGRPNLETLFPKRFADWEVDDRLPPQIVAPDAQALIKRLYDQTLSRIYVNAKGERIMLSVAYGGDQSDGTSAHRPEVCYPSQGFQILSKRDTSIDAATHSLHVRQLVTKLGARVEPVSYWIVVGDQVALSGTQQKLAQLKYGFRGLIPDGMLIRVSNINTDEGASFSLHQAFVSEMTRAIPEPLKVRVVGARAQ